MVYFFQNKFIVHNNSPWSIIILLLNGVVNRENFLKAVSWLGINLLDEFNTIKRYNEIIVKYLFFDIK